MSETLFWDFVSGRPGLSMKELSLDDKLGRIRSEINKQVNPSQAMTGGMVGAVSPSSSESNPYWVYQLYPEYAILCKNSEYFQVNYHLDGETVVIGSLIPVEMCWRPKNPTAPQIMGAGGTL